MTPSNPPNGQPLIYRICDAAGVFHLVAPVNHTHTYAEVPGLQDELSELWAGLSEKANQEAMTEALAGKQNTLTFDPTPTDNSTNPVTSGGVKAALDGKHNLVGQTISFVINGQEIEIEPSDVPNLIRALSDPDSTPTANSNNLVTSGGVKAAIDSAIAIRYYSGRPLIEDVFGDASLQKVDVGILNSTGSDATITGLFSLSGGQTLLLPDDAPTIPNGKMVLLHLFRTVTQNNFIAAVIGIYTIS